ARAFSTPTGLRLLRRSRPQPRWGCRCVAQFPRVARAAQPWALGRNPIGIPSRKSRRVLNREYQQGVKINASGLVWRDLFPGHGVCLVGRLPIFGRDEQTRRRVPRLIAVSAWLWVLLAGHLAAVEVVGWGGDLDRELQVPASATNVVAIYAGGFHG